MKSKSHVSNMLDRLGLTNYEAKTYLSLLEKKQLTAAEVSQIANVPKGRIYDTLEKLEFKGLCHVISGKVKLYSAVNPTRLMDVLIKLEKDKVDLKISKFQEAIKKEKNLLVEKTKEAQKLAKDLIPLYENSRRNDKSLDYLEVYKNPLPIHLKLIELCTRSQKEILIFVKPPFASRTDKQKAEAVNPQIEALERGVKLRTIHEIPDDEKERERFFKRLFDTYEPDKEDLRVIDYLPMKLMVFDEKIVLFTLFDPMMEESSLTGFVAENEAFARGQKDLFNLYWNKANDLDMYR